VIKDSEISVYDIHEHPDYKFRPGYSVIRVAGFEVSLLTYTAGYLRVEKKGLKTGYNWLRLTLSVLAIFKWVEQKKKKHKN
jgi:hypothetical protein